MRPRPKPRRNRAPRDRPAPRVGSSSTHHLGRAAATHTECSDPSGEGTRSHPPNGGCVATTAYLVGLPMDELPIDECRRLVAIRTGVIGYPDAHAIGVAQCSLRIAARLEVDDEVRRAVVHGALLHDVGKLRINERILSKPGPLTLEERLC